LMSADRRGDTGSFYTPPHMVGRLTSRVLTEHVSRVTGEPYDAISRLVMKSDPSDISPSGRHAVASLLRETRVLDPACGSGAFLLGALSHLAGSRVALGEDPVTVRRDVVGRSLHGVDLLDDAALLCSLRLWLALADTSESQPPPLPNLDRRIRQGDALLDPLELAGPRSAGDIDGRARRDRDVRSAVSDLLPLATAYVNAGPEERVGLRTAVADAERRIATAWLTALSTRLQHGLKDARARSETHDLWDVLTPAAREASRQAVHLEGRLREVQQLIDNMRENAVLPFFSFRVHFAESTGFDMVLSNPPWVRAHRWPAAVGAAVRERYEVCAKGGQVDLSLLFLERSLSLLNDGGTLGMLLPAKTLRSAYGGAARALLLRDTQIAAIEDYGLDQRAIFRADAFTMALVARKVAMPRCPATLAGCPSDNRETVQVRLVRRGVEPLDFAINQCDLPAVPGDNTSPWMLAPPDVLAAFRKMESSGARIVEQPGISVRRGVVTGANDVLVVRECVHKLGGLSHIRAEGYFRARKLSHSTAVARKYCAYVETAALRPLLRGSDVRAWCVRPASRVVWIPGGRGSDACPPRMQRYLQRHASALRARARGSAAGHAPTLRISPAMLGHKVVWQDIAQTLNAAVVPALSRADDGTDAPVIPLNTVYFIAVDDAETALLLSAYLNSLPVRTFARAIAERAKDARFRFFAWTVRMLPLPRLWQSAERDSLLEIARSAHENRGLNRLQQLRLDALVAQVFGLGDADLIALLTFDRWLSGES
ncbi:MAG: hypothetical protein ABIS27_01135, partial [Longimicrobiales bacterium]